MKSPVAAIHYLMCSVAICTNSNQCCVVTKYFEEQLKMNLWLWAKINLPLLLNGAGFIAWVRTSWQQAFDRAKLTEMGSRSEKVPKNRNNLQKPLPLMYFLQLELQVLLTIQPFSFELSNELIYWLNHLLDLLARDQTFNTWAFWQLISKLQEY